MRSAKEQQGLQRARIGLLVSLDEEALSSRAVQQLQRSFPGTQVTLFTEACAAPERSSEKSSGTGAKVACWKRSSSNYSELAARIAEYQIDILHILAPIRFFANSFSALLDELKQKNIGLVAEIRNPEQLDSQSTSVLQKFDRVLLPNEQTALELLAQGFRTERLVCLPQGSALSLIAPASAEARAKLKIQSNEQLLVIVSDCTAGGETAEIIATVERLTETSGSVGRALKPKIAVVPLVSLIHPSGATYFSRLETSIPERLRVSEIPIQLAAEDYIKLIAAADAVIFASARPYAEASELFNAALALGKAVVVPNREPFTGHEGRVIYSNSRISLNQAAQAIWQNQTVRQELERRAKAWGETQTYEERVNHLVDVYSNVYLPERGQTVPTATKTALGAAAPISRKEQDARIPKILMQNRENAYSHPGGDTIVMDRISEGLRARGVTVDIDLKSEKNPSDYDLVHLFNFAMKENTERLARRCFQSGVPYVVTTMYEDWPLFFNQMHAQFSALDAYRKAGQPLDRWSEFFQQAKNVRPSPIWDNSLTANNAAALIASGQSEAAALRRDYPGAKLIDFYQCGADAQEAGDGGEAFRREYGVSDFIFCVGRFELRKNQLMLLKAFEESDHTIVFAGAGFSYQPMYLEACKAFRRKGKTLFLDRLEPKMLASAYQAARVHALPSWLELPGIVSLEAALYGTNVVATEFGTARDALGDGAFYCRPDDPSTIYNSVLAAYHAPKRKELQERVKGFTWDKAALQAGATYRSVLASLGHYDWSFLDEKRVAARPPEVCAEESVEKARFQTQIASQSVRKLPVVLGEPIEESVEDSRAARFCDEGDALCRKGETLSAKKSYLQAIQTAPKFARGYRSCGVLALGEKKHNEAKEFFEQALKCDSDDIKSLLGLGSVQWELGRKEDAFETYLRAARTKPSDSTVIFYLVQSAYSLNRLKDLEQALRAFLKSDPDNINILYCLAGCSYKRGRFFLSKGVVERILKIQPDHKDALELQKRLTAEQLVEGRSGRAASNKGFQLDAAKIAQGVSASFNPGQGTQSLVTSAQTGSSPGKVTERLHVLEAKKTEQQYAEVSREIEDILQEPNLSASETAHARVLQAECFACQGQLEQAESIFRQFEGEANFGYRALCGRGVVAATMNNWAQAEELFQKSLKLNPRHDVAHAGLGLCDSQAGKNENAWDRFLTALEINPENLRAIYGAIQLGYLLNRLPATAEVLERYLDLHPVDLSMNYAYAGCCFALGRRERALEELRKILLFDPTHKLALELLEKIQAEEKSTMNASR